MIVIEREGSVRIDLLGGTLDLYPINLIIPEVVTINLATTLKVKIKISRSDQEKITLASMDYHSVLEISEDDFTYDRIYKENYFSDLTFAVQIIDLFPVFEEIRSSKRGILIEISLGIPPGSGLGASSAMAVTLYRALSDFFKISIPKDQEIANIIQNIESRILKSGPCGYQDYYPPLKGGILALRPNIKGEIEVLQLFSDELKEYLSSHLTLIYSGESRLSGIPNWEIYKAFFDGHKKVIDGLKEIAHLSKLGLDKIRDKDFEGFVDLISQEGFERAKLFNKIHTLKVENFYREVRKNIFNTGLKVCGAGGGGTFLLIHERPEDRRIISDLALNFKMKILDFEIERP